MRRPTRHPNSKNEFSNSMRMKAVHSDCGTYHIKTCRTLETGWHVSGDDRDLVWERSKRRQKISFVFSKIKIIISKFIESRPRWDQMKIRCMLQRDKKIKYLKSRWTRLSSAKLPFLHWFYQEKSQNMFTIRNDCVLVVDICSDCSFELICTYLLHIFFSSSPF